MNQRQRILILILVATILLAGGGGLVYSFAPGLFKGKSAQVEALQKEIADRRERLAQMQKNRARLNRWKQQSLPADIDLARREYEKYLRDLLQESNFPSDSMTVTPKPEDSKTAPKLANKQPIYTKLDFTITGRAPLESIVALLQRFYGTGLLHQVKNLAVTRPATGASQQNPQRLRDLDVSLTVEALVVNGADKRPFLTPIGRMAAALDLIGAKQRGVGGVVLAAAAAVPGGLTAPGRLAPTGRNYETVAARNVFVGPPPPPPPVEETGPDMDALKFVYLTSITRNSEDRDRPEASLYNRLTNTTTRLATRIAFSTFIVGERDKPAVKGDVVRVDELERQIIFKTPEGKYYALQLGQNLADAMKKTLPEDKVKELTGPKAEAAKPGSEKP